MKKKLKLLFVDQLNLARAKTACFTMMMHHRNNFDTRDRGSDKTAQTRVSAEDVEWADIIFAIEEEQRKYIESRYPDAAEKKKIFVLGIPYDENRPGPELIQLLSESVNKILESMDEI
jgi:predicted protein tyrosine phosphatase